MRDLYSGSVPLSSPLEPMNCERLPNGTLYSPNKPTQIAVLKLRTQTGDLRPDN